MRIRTCMRNLCITEMYPEVELSICNRAFLRKELMAKCRKCYIVDVGLDSKHALVSELRKMSVKANLIWLVDPHL